MLRMDENELDKGKTIKNNLKHTFSVFNSLTPEH